MKAYDELKDAIEDIYQRMAEANENEFPDAVKEEKRRCKEFGFNSSKLKGSLVKGRSKI
jgi:hypothetical protein